MRLEPSAADPRLERLEIAVEALYRESYRDVYQYVLALTRHAQDAEDITGDTFERAYRAWNASGQLPARPLPWLLLTARRLATDRFRRAARRLRRGAALRTDEVAPSPEAASRVWFDAFVRALPTRQREVLILRYLHDLPDAEVGALMGLSESGVRSLVARAIATLRRHPEVWND